ncbi:unnamed protein product [Ectocarpus fasciculatus]
MRSMEVAISEDNLPMVKILRTVDYPFVEDSFTFACDTENVDMVKYLLQEGCKPPTDLPGISKNVQLLHPQFLD